MGVAGLRGTGLSRVRPTKPGAWRRVVVRCVCGEAWESTVLEEHTTVRCRRERCDERVPVPPREEP